MIDVQNRSERVDKQYEFLDSITEWDRVKSFNGMFSKLDTYYKFSNLPKHFSKKFRDTKFFELSVKNVNKEFQDRYEEFSKKGCNRSQEYVYNVDEFRDAPIADIMFFEILNKLNYFELLVGKVDDATCFTEEEKKQIKMRAYSFKRLLIDGLINIPLFALLSNRYGFNTNATVYHTCI